MASSRIAASASRKRRKSIRKNTDNKDIINIFFHIALYRPIKFDKMSKKMHKMHKVPVNLTKANMEKLFEGRKANLSYKHLSGKKHYLHLQPDTAMVLSQAYQMGQGCGLKLNRHEMEMNGGNIKDFFRAVGDKAKKGYDYYQKNIKPTASPYIRKGLVSLLSSGQAALSVAQPELAPALALLSRKNSDIVDAIGNKTGAFGFRASGGNLEAVKVSLTPLQARKLSKGKVVQLKASQLQSGEYVLFLNSMQAKKLHSAKRRHKGFRVKLSEMEMEQSGGSLKSVYSKVKSVYSKHLKEHAAPHVRKAVKKGIKKGFSKLQERLPQYSDELSMLESRVSPYLEDKIGEVSGAYGINDIMYASQKGPPAMLANKVGRGARGMNDIVYVSQKGPPARLANPVGRSIRDMNYVSGKGGFRAA